MGNNAALANVFAPMAFRFRQRNVDIGDTWGRVYAITNFPPKVPAAWLARAANLPGVTLAMHCLPTDPTSLTKSLNRAISLISGNLQVGGNALTMQRLEAQLKDAQRLMKQIDQEQQSIFTTGVFLLVTAPNETVGFRRAKRVEGLVAAAGMRARVLAFRQEEGLLAAGPWGIFPKELRGGSPFQLSSGTLAAAFPFSSGGLNHGHGTVLGPDADGGIVLIDRWNPPGDDITNKNFNILSPPGGGKSVATRAMLLREWQMGAKVIAIDPEKREYQRMCHRVGGTWINAAGGKVRINPYHAPVIPVPEDQEAAAEMGVGLSPIAAHIMRVQTFHQLLLPELSQIQQALLVQATRAIYQDVARINLDTDPGIVPAQDWPHIGHLHEYCKVQKGDDWSILTALTQDAAEGIAAQIWAGPSTVPSTAGADFVVLDIQDLTAAPDNIRRAQFFNTQAYSLDLIRNDRADKKILAVDEAWKQIDHRNPQSLQFMKSSSKLVRGYNGSFMCITQNVADFMHEAIRGDGEQVLTNSAFTLLLRQGPKDLEVLTKLFTLSEEEQSRLSNAKIGEGLLIAGNRRVWMKVDIAPHEWQYIGGSPKKQ